MQIYIHRGNEDFGPYSREAVLEYVKQGVFESLDYACYAGMSEWKTIGELLGIDGPEKKGETKGHGSTRITEFRSTWEASSGKRRPGAARGSKKTLMILLNVFLICLVILVGYIRLGGGGRTLNRYLPGFLSRMDTDQQADNGPAVQASPMGFGPSSKPAHGQIAPASPPLTGRESADATPAGVPSVSPAAGSSQPVSGAPAVVSVAAASPAASGSQGGYIAPPVPTPGAGADNGVSAAAPTPMAGTGATALAAAPPVGSGGGYVPPASGPGGQSAATREFDQAANPALASNSPGSPNSPAAAQTSSPAEQATPTPVPAATPPPRPRFNPGRLASDPKSWPKTLKLKKAVNFPDVVGTQVMGTVTVPAGSIVDLMDIEGDQVTVRSFGGGKQSISYKLTDLEEQVESAQQRRAPLGF